MPISSLPDSTLRAITSTLVLNDAVSVVKELVDNAIDAKATAIAVEISTNTLDAIQVKDNGTGIGVEDRQLVCKRGCTSKITTLEDLERLGGSSLGFRGEALASVADLSDSVTLITRVDGETAGSLLKYGPAGALLSCSSTSHPIGSTLRVKNFLKAIPVRKQSALKNASKTLSAIKKLLQSYAFARGSVRFSLKVLKAKNEKANWSYNPVDNVDDLREVATRIVGKDVGGGCKTRTWAGHGSASNSAEGDEYSVVALLAELAEGDTAKPNNIGHYISVDGRPVTAARGTFKEIIRLYRHYVRNDAALVQGIPASFDPILVMHITCPRGSYDVNVEPAKDEVMFVYPSAVLAIVESLFKDHYDKHLQSGTATTPKDKTTAAFEANSSFSLLLANRVVPAIKTKELSQAPLSSVISLPSGTNSPDAKNQPHEEQDNLRLPCSGHEGSEVFPKDDQEGRKIAHTAHSTMYGFDDDDDPCPPSPESRDTVREPEEVEDLVARNPWSLAKLNSPARRVSDTDNSNSSTAEQDITIVPPQHGDSQLCQTPQASTHRRPLGLRPQLPSPVTSPHSPDAFQNPGPPKRPWPSRQRKQGSDPGSEPEEPASPATPMPEWEKVSGPLDSWTKPMTAQAELCSLKPFSEIYNEDGLVEQAPDNDSTKPPMFRSHPSRVQTTLNIGNSEPPQRASPMSRPFRSPSLISPARSASHGIDHSLNGSGVVPDSQQISLKLSQSQNPELDQIMEFEHRKKAANDQQRKAFGKVQVHGMSVARLAQLQWSTGRAPNDDRGAMTIPGYQAPTGELERFASTVPSFADKFNQPPAGTEINTKSNSHKNRYLAAARSLTRSRGDIPGSDIRFSRNVGLAEIMDDDHEIPKIPEDDARAYLMRHQSYAQSATADGLNRTGLKLRRTKTQRLPFESVPPDMMLYNVVAHVKLDVQACTQTIPGGDKYITTGKNDFIMWASAGSDVLLWQNELTTLIRSTYRARIGDELTTPNLALDLTRMIKTHCDNI